jgi:two-component system, sporulation sensor kinase E
MKTGFLDKLMDRLDRLDPASIQAQFLRLARERGLLETVFQSIQEGVLVVDEKGRLTYANRAAERLMGFSMDQVDGQTVASLLPDVDWDRIMKFDETEWTRLISREMEITYPVQRFLTFYVVPLDMKKQGGAVIILRDITQDRVHEAGRVESERLNAVKLLAAGVAHEIGNPLNALNIHLQLLSREIRKLPVEQATILAEYAETARREVGRLDIIISQFLRAIRPTAPTLTLQRPEHLLEETMRLLKEEIADRKIQLYVTCEPSLPQVQVDQDQMKQAFFNIVKNALQAMTDGQSLTIALSATDRYVRFSFRDTGSGISPESFGHIFEPYFTTKSSGSGLGLMIVQRIVQDHGGLLDVTSEPDAGTTFAILLPVAEKRIRMLPRSSMEPEPTERPKKKRRKEPHGK